ncbi:uncharacterized protein LOC113278946 [Papaver somniferum]|uniref:uncharacterized protein LOC113278946 n=1 Tax=Papaver somniferum TaxID=3469 RepID=UPI000E6F5BBB|nr:uncharacterized protein LOC113278946 [Papaver somniferum]
MGNKIGRAIKFDEATLKRQSGYYASVLVEVNLVNYIPSKIVVESKYDKFEEYIQIPKLPKYCIHCKNIGNYVAECRIQRKNQQQEMQPSEIPNKVWEKKTIPPKVGFDICNSPKEKFQETPTSVWQVDKIVEATTQQTVVPPIQNNTPALNKEKGFTRLLESPSDFPSLSVDKLIDVGANNNTSHTTEATISEGWNEVPGSIAKFKNAHNNINSGRMVKPNVITRKQANTSVKSNSNLGGDFNVVLSYEEKIGGRRPLRISMQEFRNCLESCNLIQATRIGIKYSWCNNRAGVRGTSDHGPLFGSTVNIGKPTNAPFRYQNIWTSHPGFLDVIKDAWNEAISGNPAFSFMSKLKD